MGDEKNTEAAVDIDALEAEIARLEEAGRKRAKEIAISDRVAHLEKLKLIDEHSRKLGKIGHAFAVVDLSEVGDGFIVVKLGTEGDYNAFQSSNFDAVARQKFVEPAVVHPEPAKLREILSRRPAVLFHVANALSGLHGADAKIVSGK